MPVGRGSVFLDIFQKQDMKPHMGSVILVNTFVTTASEQVFYRLMCDILSSALLKKVHVARAWRPYNHLGWQGSDSLVQDFNAGTIPSRYLP